MKKIDLTEEWAKNPLKEEEVYDVCRDALRKSVKVVAKGVDVDSIVLTLDELPSLPDSTKFDETIEFRDKVAKLVYDKMVDKLKGN